MKGYGQYTLYVCEKCGKLGVFLKKAKMVSGKRKTSKLQDGQLAGAFYGEKNIPPEWITKLVQRLKN